jgi:perosamine synthetase
MAVRMIKVAEPLVGEEEVQAVREVILSGQYVSGRRVEEFERRFAEYIGVRYAVAVSNGTAALHTALAAMGVGPGDEVIVPPLTFFSTVTSVIHAGAVPIFADIDPESFCLDPADVRRRITPRTKVILPVHLFGNAADLDGLRAVASEWGLKLLEDCAQAHGTEYRGRKVGSFGDAGIFSFYATKAMTTGEGGIITTDDEHIYEYSRLFRGHGMPERDTHVILGYNYRMSEIQAAMGLVQLDRLEESNRLRIANSEWLRSRLRDIPWLRVPKVESYVRHTYFWCPIYIDEEKAGRSFGEVVRELRDRGIEVRQRYKTPLYKQPLMANRNFYANGKEWPGDSYGEPPDYAHLHLPNVEKVAGKLLGLPNHPQLTPDDLEYIVRTLHELGPS